MNTRPFTSSRTTQKPWCGASVFVVACALACLLLLTPWMRAGLVAAQAPPKFLAPTITTELPEYEPGDAVVYSGDGFRRGEIVDVLASGSTNGSEVSGQSIADGTGAISGVLFLPLTYEVSYSVTATGLTSGRTAQTSFTDRVSLKIQTPSSPVRLNPGQVQLYVAVAQTSGGMGVQGLTLRWAPTGGTVNALISTTDTSGEASTLYTAGTVLGRHEVYAEAVTDPMINARQFLDIVAGKTTPTITWSNPADIVYGTALSAAQLNATASVLGTFVYTPPAGTVLGGGTGQTLHADFTPTDTTNYNSATADVTINVLEGVATVSLGNLSQTYDGTPKAVTATTTPPGLSVSMTYNGSGTVPTNAGSYAVVATIADPNYSGTASGTLVIAKATPAITWSNPADIVYGTALSSTQLNATASVAGSFVYTPGAGTVLNAGPGQLLHAAFTPADVANYESTIRDVLLRVNPTLLVIRANDKTKVYGAPLPPLDASYSGFVLGQGPGVLAGSLACATTATATSVSGTYPITCSGQTSSNYAITFAAGTLTITGDPPPGVTPVASSTPASAGARAVGGIAERPSAEEPATGMHFWDWAVGFSSVVLVVLAVVALGGTGARGLRRRK